MSKAAPPQGDPVKRMSGQETAEHILEAAKQLRDLSDVIGALELRELFSKVIGRTQQIIADKGPWRTPGQDDREEP